MICAYGKDSEREYTSMLVRCLPWRFKNKKRLACIDRNIEYLFKCASNKWQFRKRKHSVGNKL